MEEAGITGALPVVIFIMKLDIVQMEMVLFNLSRYCPSSSLTHTAL